jgi:hypothetical protein
VIKGLRFDAYLTNRRLVLATEGRDWQAGGGREIPVDAIREGCLETTPEGPVLAIRVGTASDIRTMKLRFGGPGQDRLTEVQEWVRQLCPPVIQPTAREEVHGPEAGTVPEVAPGRTGPVAIRDVRIPEAGTVPEVAPAGPGPAEGKVRFCYQCGRNAPEEGNFCPFCGTPLHRPERGLPRPPETGRQAPAEEQPTESILRKLLRR